MRTKRRYGVYVGLFAIMFVSYLDRVNLSVAAGSIARSYDLSPIDMGYVFSAFLWTYLVCLIPIGLVADRFGSRTVTYTALFVWSLAGVWTGLATSYASLFASRLVLGVGEAAAYPAGATAIRDWAPAEERGIASAFLNCGAHAGLCVGSIVVGALIATFGWRESFYITGAMGLTLAALWFALYQRPERASWLPEEERQAIVSARSGSIRDAQFDAAGEPLKSGTMLAGLLRSPTMLALALTQGCAGYTLYLFMTWLPNYLAVSRGLDVLKTGMVAAIPYGVAAVLGLGLGWWSDRILRRPGRKAADRRKLIAAALLLSSVILATPFVHSVWLIVGLFSLSLACVATAMAMTIALTTDLLTDGRCNGVAISILIMGGNLFGTAAPIVTGYIVAETGGFSGAFLIAGALLLGGAVIVMLGARAPIVVSRRAAVGHGLPAQPSL